MHFFNELYIKQSKDSFIYLVFSIVLYSEDITKQTVYLI